MVLSLSLFVQAPPARPCCPAPEQKPVTTSTRPQPRYNVNTGAKRKTNANQPRPDSMLAASPGQLDGSTARSDPARPNSPLSTTTSPNSSQQQNVSEGNASVTTLLKESATEKLRKRDRLRAFARRMMKRLGCIVLKKEDEEERPPTLASTNFSGMVNRVCEYEGIDDAETTSQKFRKLSDEGRMRVVEHFEYKKGVQITPPRVVDPKKAKARRTRMPLPAGFVPVWKRKDKSMKNGPHIAGGNDVNSRRNASDEIRDEKANVTSTAQRLSAEEAYQNEYHPVQDRPDATSLLALRRQVIEQEPMIDFPFEKSPLSKEELAILDSFPTDLSLSQRSTEASRAWLEEFKKFEGFEGFEKYRSVSRNAVRGDSPPIARHSLPGPRRTVTNKPRLNMTFPTSDFRAHSSSPLSGLGQSLWSVSHTSVLSEHMTMLAKSIDVFEFGCVIPVPAFRSDEHFFYERAQIVCNNYCIVYEELAKLSELWCQQFPGPRSSWTVEFQQVPGAIILKLLDCMHRSLQRCREWTAALTEIRSQGPFPLPQEPKAGSWLYSFDCWEDFGVATSKLKNVNLDEVQKQMVKTMTRSRRLRELNSSLYSSSEAEVEQASEGASRGSQVDFSSYPPSNTSTTGLVPPPLNLVKDWASLPNKSTVDEVVPPLRYIGSQTLPQQLSSSTADLVPRPRFDKRQSPPLLSKNDPVPEPPNVFERTSAPSPPKDDDSQAVDGPEQSHLENTTPQAIPEMKQVSRLPIFTFRAPSQAAPVEGRKWRRSNLPVEWKVPYGQHRTNTPESQRLARTTEIVAVEGANPRPSDVRVSGPKQPTNPNARSDSKGFETHLHTTENSVMKSSSLPRPGQTFKASRSLTPAQHAQYVSRQKPSYTSKSLPVRPPNTQPPHTHGPTTSHQTAPDRKTPTSPPSGNSDIPSRQEADHVAHQPKLLVRSPKSESATVYTSPPPPPPPNESAPNTVITRRPDIFISSPEQLSLETPPVQSSNAEKSDKGLPPTPPGTPPKTDTHPTSTSTSVSEKRVGKSERQTNILSQRSLEPLPSRHSSPIAIQRPGSAPTFAQALPRFNLDKRPQSTVSVYGGTRVDFSEWAARFDREYGEYGAKRKRRGNRH
ncbi:hypothetical protein BDV96DRAFT_37897 [Lophiotrema nucula]|uniref:Uncharacterized protein n=1 Tax=Lophiotrema nucula TaxID=690887 RepID=A0A6A5ZCI0_9PLEO|nr:hypothetical protein BDV96DRAFT_37897 [Lophiotrema nucula]